ncbi:protein SCAI [Impatiens glandulifera]|uniref:protein SCAI n=1 Tax=Impatiens glandulifera TaxID=253017 RepID=UPI001FB0AAC0|nr:protein SCAI [Impatiens glandulifera]
MMTNEDVSKNFRSLVEAADRKFAKVRDVPAYGCGPSQSQNFQFQKVFKAYMKLWKYQQVKRTELVELGLQRWEIGEIASRIGQLYFGQYLRTSEARFLLESYIFYEATINRRYFDGSKDRGVRFKELRFYARFLLVSLILNRFEMVKILAEKLKALVDDIITNFPETNFKEWKLVVQEITRFMRTDIALGSARPMRYCAIFDAYTYSHSYVARFHANKVLKFRDAILTSYHRNEVKFAEFTLDSFRMLQSLEWESSGSFYQKRQIELQENGGLTDQSLTSGLIDINLAADMADPSLPPNPKKAILYHPSVTQLIAVIATICEELAPERVLLLYISASGKAIHINNSVSESTGAVRMSSKVKIVSHTSHGNSNSGCENHVNENGKSSHPSGDSLWLGPCRNGGSNNLYPHDIIPFTRKPLFLIIDSDNSHAFKMIHGSERGETAALFLSPLKPSFRFPPTGSDAVQNGSQFTLFLTSPMLAFFQLVGVPSSDDNTDLYENAEKILSEAFAQWEIIMCTTNMLDLVWAQMLSDPLLRRLIIRFIFCRSALFYFCSGEDKREECTPICLPELPASLSPKSEAVRSAVLQLAIHLQVADCFCFDNT